MDEEVLLETLKFHVEASLESHDQMQHFEFVQSELRNHLETGRQRIAELEARLAQHETGERCPECGTLYKLTATLGRAHLPMTRYH